MRPGRRVAAAVLAAVAVFPATGCAEETPPGEAVPELSIQLERVDDAIEDGDLGKARRAVQDLVAATAVARADGAITKDAADRIFEAAETVLAELPKNDGSRRR